MRKTFEDFTVKLAGETEMQKAASMLVLFFSQTVLIFGMKTHSTCAIAHFWNVNMHRCAFFGCELAQLVQPAQLSACAIKTDSTKALSQTQNTIIISVFLEV